MEPFNVVHIANDETPKQPIFRASVETTQIYDRLKASKIGDIVSYTELSEIIGKNVQYAGRSNLVSAIRMLERDRIVFASVKDIGVKNLNDIEKVQFGNSGIDRIRRLSRRSSRKILCSEYDLLDDAAKLKYNASLSVLGAVAVFSKPTSIARIEHYAPYSRLDLNRTIEMFKK